MSNWKVKTRPLRLNAEAKKIMLECNYRSGKIKFGFASDIGSTRQENEDVILIVNRFPDDIPFSMFSIFDGHGGNQAALFAHDHYPEILIEMYRAYPDMKVSLRRSLIELDRRFLEYRDCSGATALVYLVHRDGPTFVANIGDAEGLVIREGLRWENVNVRPLVNYNPLYSTLPHNLTRNPAEVTRLLQEKALIVDGRLCQCDAEGNIEGMLAVSRALGDYDFKINTPLIAFPDVEEVHLGHADKYIVLACDGLWDSLSYGDVYTIVDICRQHNANPSLMAQILVNLAIQQGSIDNVTVIVLELP